MGAEETQIEASFCAAINTAKQQKAVSLEKRAEATYAEYRRQKASEAGGCGVRLPLWYFPATPWVQWTLYRIRIGQQPLTEHAIPIGVGCGHVYHHALPRHHLVPAELFEMI